MEYNKSEFIKLVNMVLGSNPRDILVRDLANALYSAVNEAEKIRETIIELEDKWAYGVKNDFSYFHDDVADLLSEEQQKQALERYDKTHE